ncbi:hypothetical protein [Methylobacterium sp. A54F]
MTELDTADHLLEAIAAALGVRAAAFRDPANPALQQVRDIDELLRAFEKLTDPEDRRACIAFVHQRGKKQGTP